MKLFLLSSALLASLGAATDCSNTICQDYAVHAGTTITFADGVSAKTKISGDIGVSPGTSITGLEYMLFLSGEVASAGDSAEYADTVNDNHAAATATHGKSFTELSGGTFTPGTYTASSTISFAGAGTFATLDAEGDENAVFLFQAGTAMTTAANTYFKLKRGAKAENVLFALGSAATLGAGSVLEGSLIVGTSVTMGLDAQVNGCIIAKAAVTYEGRGGTNADSALTFDNWGTVLESCVEVEAQAAAPVYSDCSNSICENFAVHGGTTITFADGVSAKTTIGGDIGVSPGTSITGLQYVTFTEGERLSTPDSADFASRVNEKHSSATSTKGKKFTELSGGVFTPGTYTASSTISFAGAGTFATLDGENDENAVFLFQAGTAMTTAANTYFKLINGAKAENVLFALGSAATLGAGCVLQGSLIVGTSVTMGLDAQVNGCIIAKAAVTYEGRGGTAADSSMTFNDAGTVLEHCVEVDAPTSSPTRSDHCGNSVCEDYAIHAGTTITFANGGALTTVGGDIGVAPGTSITGMEYMMFEYGSRISTANAGDYASRVDEKHSSALATKGTPIAEMSMQTYTPGIYTSGSSINFAGAGTYCTLDAEGDENAVFVFQAGTTLTTAANTYFKLINGAKADNVLFALGSAATLGASSVLEGSLIVGTSVTVGSDAQINGCIIAKAAVTFESRGGVVGVGSLSFNDSGNGLEYCIDEEAPTASPTAGDSDCFDTSTTVCEDYALHAGTTITFANGGALTTVGGDIAVNPGTSITGMEYMTFMYGERISTAAAADFASRVNEKHSSALATKGTTIAEMSMQTYTPGIYTSGSSINFAGAGTYCTLDAKGDNDAVFVFQAGTTLTTAANTYFKLINGARAENVIFALGSAATLGASSVLEGSLIVGTSVTVGSDAQVNGCIIAKAAITFESRGGVLAASALTFNDSGTGLEHCVEVGDEITAQQASPTLSPTISPASTPTSSRGDPHFRTWKNEHFEYHGQCDLVLAKDPVFADGLGLDVHIRTKLVRFWSYIKQAVIRIGDDVFEIEGSSDPSEMDEVHYWINLEYKGELTTLGGFPVTIEKKTTLHKTLFEIDLTSKYPGVKIVLATYKEFVSVDFVNSNEQAFGNAVGLFGDFKSGKTFARDGITVLDDFTELGHEWQVLPTEVMIFHDISEPQFPQMCIDPEDPRGERRRRLDESSVTEEQAEASCAAIPDAADRKDCVYDILATQDIGMVGAY